MKLISCNIEGDRHFEERLFPFFAKEKADVLVLQEVFKVDLEKIKQASGLGQYIFCPQANIIQPNVHLPLKGEWGLAIFANEIISSYGFYYFQNHKDQLVTFENDRPDSIDRVALRVQIKIAGQIFQIINLHFTWSGMGLVTDEQRRDYQVLKKYLAQCDDLILCGDLNATRGKEIFDDLAKTYHDNIPAQIKTTIDQNLHKSGKDIQLVVDSLFTSPGYQAHNVKVEANTSDHMAIVAQIEKFG